MELNLLIFNFLYSLAGRWGILESMFIFFAKDAIYLLILSFILFFFFRTRPQKSRAIFFTQTVLALIISVGIILETSRALFYFARPFEALGFVPSIPGPPFSSFPSGHATIAFTLSALVFAYNNKLGAAFFALAVLISAARVFVGVHWPLDILGGAVFGIGSALFARKLIKDEK